jgi:hypothetical protein
MVRIGLAYRRTYGAPNGPTDGKVPPNLDPLVLTPRLGDHSQC